MAKNRKITYPFALDPKGDLVSAETAQKGSLFVCAGCSDELILRRGDQRRAHFAHKAGAAVCAPESALHRFAKQTVKRRLEVALSQGSPYPIRWQCECCRHWHHGDIAKRTQEVLIERRFEGFRPDLLLIAGTGKPRAAIEIVVSHSLEAETREMYERTGLPVVLYRATWENTEALSRGITASQTLNVPCRPDRRCEKCQSGMEPMILRVWDGFSCYRCYKSMRIAHVEYDYGYSEGITPGMIGLVTRYGIRLKVLYSRTAGRRYPMHICPKCGTGQGDFYIRTIAGINMKPVNSVPFFWCANCDCCAIA